MRRIKIVKVYQDDRYDGYESTETFRTFAEGLDWHDVDDSRFSEIEQLISFANSRKHELKADYTLQLVEEIAPASVEVHLERAKELYLQYQEKVRKQTEKDEKARLARAAKAAETQKQRDIRQLKALQAKLGVQQ